MPRKEELHKFKNPFPATDIIIEHELDGKYGIVLIERKNIPYGIAIPGGFAEYGLTLEQNAVKEAKEETGLDVVLESPEHPLCVHSEPNRDPRAHIISLFYIGKGYGKIKAGDDAKAAKFYEVSELEKIITRTPQVFAFQSHVRALKEYLVDRCQYR